MRALDYLLSMFSQRVCRTPFVPPPQMENVLKAQERAVRIARAQSSKSFKNIVDTADGVCKIIGGSDDEVHP